MRTSSVSVGTGGLRVTLDITHTDGAGMTCFLYGGTRPHVGGHALAAPGTPIGTEQLSSCDLWTATVPGHKDAEAAAAVARKLCLASGQAVSVTCGIHVDHATREQVETLLGHCLAAAELAVAQMAEDGQLCRAGGSSL